MKAVLASLRLLIRFGWLYLVILWVAQDGQTADWMPPVYAYIVLVLAQFTVLWIALAAEERLPPRPAAICGLTLLAAGSIQSLSVDAGLPVTEWTFVLDLALAVLLFWQALHLSSQEHTYGEVLGDCGRGLLWIVLTGVAITLYEAQGLDYSRSPGVLYPAFVAFAVLAAGSLAIARRFAPDDRAPDRRGPHLDKASLVGIASLSVALGIAAIAVNAILSVDVAGAAGVTATALQHPAGIGGRFLVARAAGVITAVPWLFHLVVSHLPGNAPVPQVKRVPTLSADEIAALRGHHFPRIDGLHSPRQFAHHPYGRSSGSHHGFLTVLTHLPTVQPVVLLVSVIVASILALLAWGICGAWTSGARYFRPHRRWHFRRRVAAGHGDGRTRLLGLRVLGRNRDRRFQTVRDVYRAYLKLGHQRIRPRSRDETGLEYAADVAQHWPHAAAALDHLNTLYMQARYRAELGQSAAVRAAIADLEEIEQAAKRF